MKNLTRFVGRMMAASALAGFTVATGCSKSNERSREDASADTGIVDSSIRDVSVDSSGMLDAHQDASCGLPPREVERQDICGVKWEHPCGIPSTVNETDGLSSAECQILCPVDDTEVPPYACNIEGNIASCTTCAVGRRPEGFEASIGDASTVCEWLSSVATLELAAVDAFQVLHEDLVRLEAPAELCAAALVAKADEIRHAQTISELARDYGQEVASPIFASTSDRLLYEVALENAVEGCVRETFGALTAKHQSIHASNQALRITMQTIEREETNHAQLSWDIHAWAMEKLSGSECAEIDAAMLQALEELRESALSASPLHGNDELGLPTSQTMLVWLAEMKADLLGTKAAAA